MCNNLIPNNVPLKQHDMYMVCNIIHTYIAYIHEPLLHAGASRLSTYKSDDYTENCKLPGCNGEHLSHEPSLTLEKIHGKY